jgi:hypothetical protein
MFILFALVLGVIIGYARGGRVGRLGSLRLRCLWVVPAALLIQLLIFPLVTSRPLVPYATTPLHLLSYALLFFFLIINARTWPLLAVGLGAVLNVLVITVNGGYMPSSVTALSRAGAESVASTLRAQGTYGNVRVMGSGTRLNALGDFLYLPQWFPLATAFSVGDLLMALGLAWLVCWGMGRRE